MADSSAPIPEDVKALIRYAYDYTNKAYTGITSATVDPLDPDNVHEPFSCTPIQPMTFEDGEVAVFDEVKQSWSIVKDLRGSYWYKGTEPVLIEKVGDPATFSDDKGASLGLTVNPVFPKPPDPTVCTKLGLKRAFTALGKWDEVKGYIDADPETKEDWELAVTIDRNDDLVKNMQKVMDMSDEDVTNLIKAAVAAVNPTASNTGGGSTNIGLPPSDPNA